MKILSKYILPAALVAGFLFYFLYDVLHYKVIADDCFYNAMLQNYGVGGCISGCYDIANGRWFSHIVCAFSFSVLKSNFSFYALYLSFLAVLMVFSVAALYKNYQLTFRKQRKSIASAFVFGTLFTSCLYFLLFEGRWEIWGWVSSANNHLLSVIICLALFAILIKEKQNPISFVFAIVFGACIGGLNEVNAICTAFTAIALLICQRSYLPHVALNRPALFSAVGAIIISLGINIYSGGYRIRMEGLPEFTLAQSLKNTIHTFLMPFIRYQYLPFSLGALLIFFIFLNGNLRFPKKINVNRKVAVTLACMLMIVAVSFFLHCYTLSDVVPPRGELWGYSLLLFSAFVLFERKDEIRSSF